MRIVITLLLLLSASWGAPIHALVIDDFTEDPFTNLTATNAAASVSNTTSCTEPCGILGGSRDTSVNYIGAGAGQVAAKVNDGGSEVFGFSMGDNNGNSTIVWDDFSAQDLTDPKFTGVRIRITALGATATAAGVDVEFTVTLEDAIGGSSAATIGTSDGFNADPTLDTSLVCQIDATGCFNVGGFGVFAGHTVSSATAPSFVDVDFAFSSFSGLDLSQIDSVSLLIDSADVENADLSVSLVEFIEESSSSVSIPSSLALLLTGVVGSVARRKGVTRKGR